MGCAWRRAVLALRRRDVHSYAHFRRGDTPVDSASLHSAVLPDRLHVVVLFHDGAFDDSQAHEVRVFFLRLIIPGIIKSFSYAMTPYIAVDHPDWTATQCITESRRIMYGNKWRYFCLNISFIGWYLLLIPAAFVPCGSFAQLFLQPYVQTACAAFYEDIKNF